MVNRRAVQLPTVAVAIGILLGAISAGTATVLASPVGGVVTTVTSVAAPRPSATTTTPTTATPPPSSTPPPSTPPPSTPPPSEAPSTSTTAGQEATTTATPRTTPPQPTPSTAPPADDVPISVTEHQQQVVRLTNKARVEYGCDPVTADSRIELAATKHSVDMAERQYFAHDTPEGVTFVERIKAEGYPRPGAENIARGYRGAEAVVAGWLDSPGHRKNILNCDLTRIGVGLEPDGWYWTQNFGY